MKCRLNQSLWKVSNSFSKKKMLLCLCTFVASVLLLSNHLLDREFTYKFFFNIGNFLPLQSFFFTFSSYVQVNDDLIFFRVSFLIFIFFMTAFLKKIIDRCHYVHPIKPLWRHLNLEELFNWSSIFFIH